MLAFFKTMAQAVQGVKRFMDKVIDFIVSIFNAILLIIVYIIGVGTISISSKIFGKHFLSIKKEAATYWVEKEKKTMTKNEFYRQF